MPEEGGSELHQQALVVMGFFTGFSITALVVIMQASRSFHVPLGPLSAGEYFETLISTIALVDVVSVFGILATMEVAGGIAALGSGTDRFGYACFLIGLFGLVAVFPLLLFPFTSAGAAIVLVAEAILLTVYFSAPGAAPPSKKDRPARIR
jgi:hypothetical protein